MQRFRLRNSAVRALYNIIIIILLCIYYRIKSTEPTPGREGVKKKGKWEGEAIYTFTEGPRAGKRWAYLLYISCGGHAGSQGCQKVRQDV